jgi:hypothetical protein
MQVNVAVQQEFYISSENNAGAEVCIEVQSGIVQNGQTFRAGYGSFGDTASGSCGYNINLPGCLC